MSYPQVKQAGLEKPATCLGYTYGAVVSSGPTAAGSGVSRSGGVPATGSDLAGTRSGESWTAVAFPENDSKRSKPQWPAC
jgi:hypothetical protein